ncbi:hypothetical protein [Candidatus Poriferisocius sp.]|uniref:hypothetical protein n=1 Tax=Candidatus Poriferisocius sp. TaxID=3101276 RepID=UPI003B025820
MTTPTTHYTPQKMMFGGRGCRLILYLDRSHRTALTTHRQETRVGRLEGRMDKNEEAESQPRR